ASAALLARYGLDGGFSPIGLSAWRLTVASTALILFQLFERVAKPSNTQHPTPNTADPWRLLTAGLFLAIHFATWIASLEYVSVARSTLLVATSPLWAGLVGLFVPALRPRPIFWLGLLVAGGGTILVTSQGLTTAVHKDPAWLGDLLAVVGAICIVPYLLLSQQVQTRLGTLRTVTWIYSAAAASLLLFLIPEGQLTLPRSPQVWGSIVGMAIFAQLIGHSSLNYCLKHFTAAQVATASLLEPVFASALAWAFLSERVTLLQTLGGVVLLVGVSVCLKAEPESAVLPAAD
ncbi:MAG: DMT family transporter, partial [Fimbriimonadales bacterium]